jgi:hypothetical protein
MFFKHDLLFISEAEDTKRVTDNMWELATARSQV